MVEKGVDMMIGVDILKNAYEDLCDTAILVSGDGDFYPALQAAKDQGKTLRSLHSKPIYLPKQRE